MKFEVITIELDLPTPFKQQAKAQVKRFRLTIQTKFPYWEHNKIVHGTTVQSDGMLERHESIIKGREIKNNTKRGPHRKFQTPMAPGSDRMGYTTFLPKVKRPYAQWFGNLLTGPARRVDNKKI